jgi:hypothetical protein
MQGIANFSWFWFWFGFGFLFGFGFGLAFGIGGNLFRANCIRTQLALIDNKLNLF